MIPQIGIYIKRKIIFDIFKYLFFIITFIHYKSRKTVYLLFSIDTTWTIKLDIYYIDIILFNKVIYISDYLEEGLTNNRRRHNINSANGCVARAKVFLESDSNIKAKVKSALQYQIYGRFAKKKIHYLFKNTKNKVLFIVSFLPAKIIYVKWKKTFEISGVTQT